MCSSIVYSLILISLVYPSMGLGINLNLCSFSFDFQGFIEILPIKVITFLKPIIF